MEKYKYIIQNQLFVRATYLLGIITWLFSVYGYIIFLNLNIWYWIVFGPVLFLYTLYYLISYGINLFYRTFDVKNHEYKASNYTKTPSVDVFLPVCGEPIEVITRTFMAVNALKYRNFKVFVLDDRGQESVRSLANQLGFVYLSRSNKGYMKKAGNLKFGFENSSGDFIAIFDADFAPDPNFLTETLPYTEDNKVGIIQTPQYFEVSERVNARSPLEYGAGNVQEDFYRIIQSSRNMFGGAICVGSNAIYRRSALNLVGGTYQIEHSEDVHTGVSLMKQGFSVKYIPVILATGLCPQTIRSFWHQQNRWCAGSMSLLFSKSFWQSNLTWQQKLCFSSGFLYYIVHALTPILSVQAFILLIWHYDFIRLIYAIPFIPYLAFSFIFLPYVMRIHKPKFGTLLARSVHMYAYGYAVVAALFKRNVGWVPTGVSQGTSSAYWNVVCISLIYIVAYVSAALLLAATGRMPILNINFYSVLVWIFYNIFIHSVFLIAALYED